MKRRLTQEQVLKLMRTRQGSRTHGEFAKELGIYASQLSAIYRGETGIGPRVLRALGLTKVVRYEQAA